MPKFAVTKVKRNTKRRRHANVQNLIRNCDTNSIDEGNEESEALTTFPKTSSKRSLLFENYKKKSRYHVRNGLMISFLTLGFLVIILSAVLYYKENEPKSFELHPPDPEIPLPLSRSSLKVFKKGIICVDSVQCALVGKHILEKNGSAVDTTISTLICNGLINMQSMGLGGGFLMTIYDRKLRKAIILNAREVAAHNAHESMFNNEVTESIQSGPLSIAVPGELAGYWEAHKMYGKLPWSTLFEPSIKLCENGYNLTKGVYDDVLNNKDKVLRNKELKAIFVDSNTGEFWNPGAIIKPNPQLCKTLRIVAEKNASELYYGMLGQQLIEDIQSSNGILTMKDLNDYRVKWEEPVESNLGNLTLYTTGLPGGGPLIAFVLNVLENFNFTSNSISDINSTIQTYHRIIESFKYAYAFRTKLGDPAFINSSYMQEKLISKEFAKVISLLITNNKTKNDPLYYGTNTPYVEDHGTTHISVLDSNGNAVSVTSTLNIYFGSGITSKQTGILLNSGMDDFGVPSKLNYYGIPASPANFIKPGKRSLSSMAPTILVDSKGDVNMVIGAAGGTKITTSIAFVLTRYLWLGNSLKEAIDAPRIHHQLYPMKLMYEYGVLKQVIDGLKQLGHETLRYRYRGSIINSIIQHNHTMYAIADYRKPGGVCGLH